MQVGEMFIAVRPDTKGFAGDLNQELGQAGERASTSLGQALTAGAAIAGMSRLVGAASDLNEAVNVTGLIFTESQGAIDSFAEGAAQALGQSETAARQATATFGGLLQNLGMTEEQSASLSMQLTTLASDLGSAFNEDPAVAVTALASALRGEQEPIRQFNVQLSDMAVRQEAVRLGLAETTAAVDQNGLVQGRLSLIMEQTSAVQGDFANTSTEAANAQRIAAAEAENAAASIGDNFLPVYRQGAAVVQGLARAFGALPGPIQTVATLLLAGAAVRGPVSNAFGAIGDAARGMAERFRAAGGGAQGMAAAITPGALGVTAAVAGLALIANEMANNAAQAEAARARFTALTDAFAEGGSTGIADELLATARQDFPELIGIMEDAGVGWGELVAAFEEGGPRAAAVGEQLRDQLGNISLNDTEIVAFLQTIPAAIAAAGDLAAAETEIDTSAAGTTVTLEDQAAALSEVADAASAAHDQLDALFGVQQTMDEAAIALQSAIDDLSGSLQENGRTFDISTAAGRANMEAARAQASAIRDNTIAVAAQTGSAQRATSAQDGLTGGLRRTLLAAGLSERQTDELIRTYARVPRSVITNVALTGASAAISSINAIYAAAVQAANAVGQISGSLAGGGSYSGRASGGPVGRGRAYMVGERGPELFIAPTDGRIVPNHELGGSGGTAIGGGGTVIYEVNVNVGGMAFATPDDFASVIAPTVARELGYLERNR